MGKGLRPSLPTVSGLDYEHFVFAGALAMAVLFSGMFQSVSILWNREFGFLKEVLVAPMLSGGVFPIQRVPGWKSTLIHLNPITYGVDLMRAALAQPTVFSVMVDACVVAGFAAATFALALALFRRE